MYSQPATHEPRSHPSAAAKQAHGRAARSVGEEPDPGAAREAAERFGFDFRNVRVHRDTAAEQTAAVTDDFGAADRSPEIEADRAADQAMPPAIRSPQLGHAPAPPDAIVDPALGSPGRPLKTELLVGAVDDPSEREADQVAEELAWSPVATPTRFDVKHGSRIVESGAQNLDRRAHAQVSETLAKPGRPLDDETRIAFESRFGCDFSTVRVHSDSAAASSVRALNASAYTVGDAIVFGDGRFEPHSPAGRYLLAHELAHVAQQADQPDAARARLIRRGPPIPPVPPAAPPILGATGAGAETELLYHYGDLEGVSVVNSPKGYPRLTNCDIATSVEEAAKYTGSPVRDSVKFKYELKIDRGYFLKYFKNVATRGAYSEFGTDQPIPVKYFRKVATLLRGPSGTTPPVAGGGPVGGGAASGGATAGGAAGQRAPLAPKPGSPTVASAEGGAAEGALSKVPSGVVQGAEGGAEGAAAGAATRSVLRVGLRFLTGAAIGMAIGLIVGLAYAALTRKMINDDIEHVLKHIPEDRQRKIQARIDALPAGKKKFARVSLEYTMFRSTLGPFGGPDSYEWGSVRLINVHPGNEELNFPSDVSEIPGELFGLATRKITVRMSYTVPID